jgi:hypothetical protein
MVIAFGLEFAEVSVVVYVRFPLFFGRLRINDEGFHSVTGNATLRRVAEAWFQGQPPFSSPTDFLSPTNAAIIGVIGTPIYFLAGMTGDVIWKILSGDSEDEKEGDSDFFARALRNAATWPLFSLMLGVTLAAKILRLRDPTIPVWYSALCGGAGVLVLIVPLVLFDEFKLFLVAEVLSTTCLTMAERFGAHAWKGYDLLDAGGNIAL